MVTAILMQNSESGLGGAFGGGDSPGANFHTKRGAEKVLFKATVVLAILFALSAFATLLI